MAETTREQMIAAAETLLAERGLYGASFPEVLQMTGASRGSVYHYFPGGKDELVTEALDLSERRMHDWLETKRGRPPAEIVSFFFHLWSEMLRRSDFAAGCAVSAVVTAATSDQLSSAAARALKANRDQLTDLLRAGNLQPGAAPSFASLLLASAEGAVILARGARSLGPLRDVEKQLVAQAKQLTR